MGDSERGGELEVRKQVKKKKKKRKMGAKRAGKVVQRGQVHGLREYERNWLQGPNKLAGIRWISSGEKKASFQTHSSFITNNKKNEKKKGWANQLLFPISCNTLFPPKSRRKKKKEKKNFPASSKQARAKKKEEEGNKTTRGEGGNSRMSSPGG